MNSPAVDFQPALIDRAVALARELQGRASGLQTPAEKRQQAELDRMLQTPEDKMTLIQLTDEAFRCRAAERTAEHLTHILDVQGIPRFFSPLDRALLRGFQTFGDWLPGVSVPLVKDHMQRETANVVLPAEPDLLRHHLRARQSEGVRMNLNLLGEMILGEKEAARRLEMYLEALQLPEVEVVSVKISTLYSQISPMAREATLAVVCERLELLYRNAARQKFRRNDGSETPKFVYLDMEEYRDLHLTAEAFMRTLNRRGLESVSAGLALQAYIPDSAGVQQEIIQWAKRRVAQGGAPVTIRLVKGANLEMERVDASHNGWPQAPFPTKIETDANFKRMLAAALQPENLEFVRVGVASHNLFDLAYGLVLAGEAGAGDRVQFEMLEGMANHQRRAVLERTKQLLLYAPACRKEEFLNAIGYLIRRLDENTGPENFLRHAFRLRVGSADWDLLERGFRESFWVEIDQAPRRKQDRLNERWSGPRPEVPWSRFVNEPDTDWSLPANGDWAARLVGRRECMSKEIPLVISGEEIKPAEAGDSPIDCLDPSRPGAIVARAAQAGQADVDRAVACAKTDASGWRQRGVDERNEVLGRVAVELRRARGALLWAAMANGGKTLAEADPEVSEAVDFVEFYRASARDWSEQPDLFAGPRGVVVVIPPWNFPIAIPCGGIAAALAAGNTVILKPASDTVLVGWELCQCFWRAGIPREALQFVPSPGRGAGAHLALHPDVDTVILTGGTETALRMLEARPDLRLFAETGGKNATIVTALSDRELAIKHVVRSAFGHGGQKCSATSLLLLEGEVYDDPEFKRMLCDAATSLPIGSAWDLSTRISPLIRPPSGDLETALKTLEPGESWALMPHRHQDNPNLWSPGIKYGVTAGSYTHLTEFFGPLLGVMRFERLTEAIAIVNQTGYGLTSGIHSLDEREHEIWKARVQAGNLYLNRGTTGAIVLRQPFGGFGKSVCGPALKAGGPNYIAQFMTFAPRTQTDRSREALGNASLRSLVEGIDRMSPALAPDVRVQLEHAFHSYESWWDREFSRTHDHFRLIGQDNQRRYLPFKEIRVRLDPRDSAFELIGRAAAARLTGARVIVSFSPGDAHAMLEALADATEAWAGAIEFLEESDEMLSEAVLRWPAHATERLRFASPDRVPAVVRRAAAAAGVYLADEPVLPAGRVELLWYLREQSLSWDYHRYGNLGDRVGEARNEPPPASSPVDVARSEMAGNRDRRSASA